ncbi:hypothetical protein V6N11_082383 [Hibiscus sabdariffa]|uniref:Uncharacterized protein n=2 Tax=Hibiscus sabdariffa TaxID=183260 RepID=A0ABR2BT83_9ROSI
MQWPHSISKAPAADGSKLLSMTLNLKQEFVSVLIPVSTMKYAPIYPIRPSFDIPCSMQQVTCREVAGVIDGEICKQNKQLFVEQTGSYSIPQLERPYTRIMKGNFETRDKESRANDPKAFNF